MTLSSDKPTFLERAYKCVQELRLLEYPLKIIKDVVYAYGHKNNLVRKDQNLLKTLLTELLPKLNDLSHKTNNMLEPTTKRRPEEPETVRQGKI